MNKVLGLALLLSAISMPTTATSKKSNQWIIKNKSWTPRFEKLYSEFIADIGKAKKAGLCSTTDQCLRSPKANPKYYNLNPSNLKSIFADCADLPYILRGYFSWMNDLPFSYPSSLTPSSWNSPSNQRILDEISKLQRELSEAGFIRKRIIKIKIKKLRKELNGGDRKVPDLRYNSSGNIVKSKTFIKNGDDVNSVFRSISGSISTASFRTDAALAGEGRTFRDTYPVAINRDSIVPGTVLYDPNGHVAVVYEVTKTGKIHLIDAHPDNSLTAITYGEKFSRTSSKIGGGFSNWRPFTYSDSAVEFKRNNELENFSLEQFQKSDTFSFNNTPMGFYEYVRNKLSLGNLVYEPIQEFNELLDELCYEFKERKSSVDKAITAKINHKSHPSKLPSNIYGTDGEWETYSTPSRDARLKASIREGKSLVEKLISLDEAGSASIIFNGENLVADLRDIYLKKTSSCSISIDSSAGEVIKLNLDELFSSIYKQSFDPYHCIELRWGLENSASCNDSSEKLQWYSEEQGLRNRIDRDYSLAMDYGLGELESAEISDVYQEDISIWSVLSRD